MNEIEELLKKYGLRWTPFASEIRLLNNIPTSLFVKYEQNAMDKYLFGKNILFQLFNQRGRLIVEDGSKLAEQAGLTKIESEWIKHHCAGDEYKFAWERGTFTLTQKQKNDMDNPAAQKALDKLLTGYRLKKIFASEQIEQERKKMEERLLNACLRYTESLKIIQPLKTELVHIAVQEREKWKEETTNEAVQ